MNAARWVLIVLAALVGVTAVPGGVALIAGVYTPPVAQLHGVFPGYVVPGLVLCGVVGGMAIAATLMLVRRSPASPFAAALAGIVLMTFEFVETLVIGSPPGPARVLQIAYFCAGLALTGVSLAWLAIERMGSAEKP